MKELFDIEGEKTGSRKVVLTKWMLIIFSLGTFCYIFVMGSNGWQIPDNFFMNFVLGLGAIGGSFTVGNIFEHQEKTKQMRVEKGIEDREKKEVSQSEKV